MPAQRPRAAFEPLPPDFDVKKLVESTPNFSYVDRISCDMIDQQGVAAFEKLILLHVVIGGKPLVIDGYEERLDPWTFTPKWLRDNCGEKHENAWDLRSKELLPLTMRHYLSNMSMLTNQFFSKPNAYKESKRQRVYLKDIDCPPVWFDKLKAHIPTSLTYLNESTGEVGGPGAVPENNAPGKRLGKGIARAGDLMSSLPPDMRAENLMCYIGHEGTYTPAHREMCASLGHNIMVEASSTVSDDGKPEKPGSSIWFMTESKDRHTVSEYWLSVLGHDIEVENHFAQVVAWKKAPFQVYVVEQRPGDFILIPPLAPHQVWNRGTRTMKVAWNRTTVETLEMALNEALPRSRIVCRDEQYKNKAIIYYTLQKYGNLLTLAQSQAARLPAQAASNLLFTGKIKQLGKDFRRLFNMYRQILLSEMFNPDDREGLKSFEYIPFDGNVTCAYCRGNIFNRFLTCHSCKDMLGHHTDDPDGDPYDICMDCYAMGRSCACLSNLKWVEQFRWKELASKYDTWRALIVALDGGQIPGKTPLPLAEERRKCEKKTLAEVCKEQLKRRPYHDPRKPANEPKEDSEDAEEEIVVDDNGIVQKIQKKRSKAWLKTHSVCHVCKHAHASWKMAQCTTCERWWCYGTLFRGWDKMPFEIMSDREWTCPHCLGICFAGTCKREGNMKPYEPKGTLLGHDTKKVADVRSVEALVDFSVSNLTWLKDDDPVNRADSQRLRRAGAEAQKAKDEGIGLEDDDDYGVLEPEASQQEHLQHETSPLVPIDPALNGGESGSGNDDETELMPKLQQANAMLPSPKSDHAHAPQLDSLDGLRSVEHDGYIPADGKYPHPDDNGTYAYPGYVRLSATNSGSMQTGHIDEMTPIRPFKRPHQEEYEDICMTKNSRVKKPRLTAAGFKSTDLATDATPNSASKTKNEAQRQFEREKERKALDKARAEGRFIMLQAAIKGKKRLVKLRVAASKLLQLDAQETAKAALNLDNNLGDDRTRLDKANEPTDDEAEDFVVLKSDIYRPKPKPVPLKTKELNPRVTGIGTNSVKKALIPVEKDESYGDYQRPSRTKTHGPSLEPPNSKKRGKAKSASQIEFEEVDIGSDADEDFSSPRTTRDRRSLPGYMRRRHAADEEENFPVHLPDNFRDGTLEKPRPSKSPLDPSLQGLAARSHAAGDLSSKAENGVNGNNTSASNEDFASTETTGSGIEQSCGTPAKFSSLGLERHNDASNKSATDEQNRLAKLQAMQATTNRTTSGWCAANIRNT